MYIISISEYNTNLCEAQDVNRMNESLELWEKIGNSKFFLNTNIILFLNKIDLFEKKLQQVPLKNIFSDYKGGNNKDKAIGYLKNLYLNKITNERNKKQIYCHVTCATDTTFMTKVFDDCKKIIFFNNLEKMSMSI